MATPTIKMFDKAVCAHFTVLAARAASTLRRIAEGIYEIEGSQFTVRIRHGTGHIKNILVTILQTSEKKKNLDDLKGEIGLEAIARALGERLTLVPLDDDESFFRNVSLLSDAAERLLLPYLLGARHDFQEVRNLIKRDAQKAASEEAERVEGILRSARPRRADPTS